MEIKSFYEPESGTWTHLLADSSDKVAAIIDPVWVFDPVSGLADTTFIENVLAVAQLAGYRIEWVLETHTHADHLTAADQVRQWTGAKIACGRGICGVQENFARVFNMTDTATDGSQFDRLLAEGDVIKLGQRGLPRLILPSLQINILAGAAPGTDSNGGVFLRTPFNRALADLIKGEV